MTYRRWPFGSWVQQRTSFGQARKTAYDPKAILAMDVNLQCIKQVSSYLITSWQQQRVTVGDVNAARDYAIRRGDFCGIG
jgi:hypothetical protein